VSATRATIELLAPGRIDREVRLDLALLRLCNTSTSLKNFWTERSHRASEHLFLGGNRVSWNDDVRV
jgi:hypothetical protein